MPPLIPEGGQSTATAPDMVELRGLFTSLATCRLSAIEWRSQQQ
ncbi:hypothetical protein [Pectobacterium cacticida]